MCVLRLALTAFLRRALLLIVSIHSQKILTSKRNTFFKRKKKLSHNDGYSKILKKRNLEHSTEMLVNILKRVKTVYLVSAELSGSSCTALLQSTSEPVYFLKNILSDSRQQLFLWFQSIQIYFIIKKKVQIQSILLSISAKLVRIASLTKILLLRINFHHISI